jgi:hypothetical protein
MRGACEHLKGLLRIAPARVWVDADGFRGAVYKSFCRVRFGSP